MTTPEEAQRQQDLGDEAATLAAELAERTDSLRRKCFALAKGIGLTDNDRHELSIMVPGVPEGRPGWRYMDYKQLGTIADWLTGWTFIETIRRDRPAS